MGRSSLTLRRIVNRRYWLFAFATTVGAGCGLAIGAFSVASLTLFSAPPYREPERVVHLSTSLRNYIDRDQVIRLTAMARDTPALVERAYVEPVMVVQPGGEASTAWGLKAFAASASLFRLLGVEPAIGSVFQDFDVNASPRPVLLGFNLWRDHFRGDADIVGKVVEIPGSLQGQDWIVQGVMPRGFSFPTGANFWIPHGRDRYRPTLTPDFARLAPHMSISALQTILPGVAIEPLDEYVRPGRAASFEFFLVALTLFVAATWVQGAVLLLGRVNEANNEIPVRIALGAAPNDIRRLFAAEGTYVGVTTFAICTIVSWLTVRTFTIWLPLGIDLAVTPAVWLPIWGLTGIVLAVALWAWVRGAGRLAMRGSVLHSTRDKYQSLTTVRLRLVFLATQFVLGVSIAYVAAVAVESSHRLGVVPLGYEPGGLIAVRLPVPDVSRGSSAEASRARAAIYEEDVRSFARRIAATEGVVAVASGSVPPLGELFEPTPMTAPGVDGKFEVQRLTITRGYPSVVGAKLIAGREPTAEETSVSADVRPVVIPALVNFALARLFGGPDAAVGQLIEPSPLLQYRILGVVANVKQEALEEQTLPVLMPYLPEGRFASALLVRTVTTGSARALTRIRQLLPKTLSNGAVIDCSETANQMTAPSRAQATLLSLTASLALWAVGIGLIGSAREVLSQYRLPIAIRLAVGASRIEAVGPYVMPIARVAAIATLGGILVGWTAVTTGGSSLYGITPLEWQSVSLCITLFGLIFFIALFSVSRQLTNQWLRDALI